MPPAARAFAFHFIAVIIHPFVGGKGRTVRLMQQLLLLLSGQRLARLVSSETVIMGGRDRYYLAIRQSRGLVSVHPLLEFLAECFAVAAEEAAEEGRSLLRAEAQRPPEARQRKIVSIAQKKSKFSKQEIVAWMSDVPCRKVVRDVVVLIKQRVIDAQGASTARVYRLARRRK